MADGEMITAATCTRGTGRAIAPYIITTAGRYITVTIHAGGIIIYPEETVISTMFPLIISA